METRDVFLAGYAARLIQDRQQAEREALALRAEYMAQVTAYMNQGYAIDEAHALVQEFYERQAQMQAQIEAPQRAVQAQNRKIMWGLAAAVVALFVIVGVGQAIANRPGTSGWCTDYQHIPSADSITNQWDVPGDDTARYERLCSAHYGEPGVFQPGVGYNWADGSG